jgi:branched-chain amino acid transport system ATP-binding protein
LAILETHKLTKDFAGFRAVDQVNLELEEGQVYALVGPNGAGKTTLFNLLTAFLKPTAGQIIIFGRDVTRLRPDQIAQHGVARSFQITSLFQHLTVLEHVVLALQARTNYGYRFWQSEHILDQFGGRALDLLGEVGLTDMAERQVASLPYGQKRALEIALALALKPGLLLLDEPTSGMSLEDVQHTIALIQRAREGRTVVLVEHNMGVVAQVADVVMVMQYGRIIAQGPYQMVREDPKVIEAYLGQAHA